MTENECLKFLYNLAKMQVKGSEKRTEKVNYCLRKILKGFNSFDELNIYYENQFFKPSCLLFKSQEDRDKACYYLYEIKRLQIPALNSLEHILKVYDRQKQLYYLSLFYYNGKERK